jgi:hypothetical protein
LTSILEANTINQLRRSRIGGIFRGATEIINGSSTATLPDELDFRVNFEKCMEYFNYFPENNFNRVLDRVTRENFMFTKKDLAIYNIPPSLPSINMFFRKEKST